MNLDLRTLRVLFFFLVFSATSKAFTAGSRLTNRVNYFTSNMSDEKKPCEAGGTGAGAPHPFSVLPGDPSLVLTTSVDLGDKKVEIMKAISKAIAARTGKPETYVGVCINDNASILFGGTDEPAALGCVYSIGAIATESNGLITSDITDQLEPYGVAENRIYVNFFDMPRANVGWSRKTFAG